jgi:hypothetical protein
LNNGAIVYLKRSTIDELAMKRVVNDRAVRQRPNIHFPYEVMDRKLHDAILNSVQRGHVTYAEIANGRSTHVHKARCASPLDVGREHPYIAAVAPTKLQRRKIDSRHLKGARPEDCRRDETPAIRQDQVGTFSWSNVQTGWPILERAHIGDGAGANAPQFARWIVQKARSPIPVDVNV